MDLPDLDCHRPSHPEFILSLHTGRKCPLMFLSVRLIVNIPNLPYLFLNKFYGNSKRLRDLIANFFLLRTIL